MTTELERIEALGRRNGTLEREIAELRAKVSSIETDLALIPGLITTGFRHLESPMANNFAQVDRRFDELEARMSEGFDATIRAVAEIIKDGK
jgi:hypothetical protein